MKYRQFFKGEEIEVNGNFDGMIYEEAYFTVVEVYPTGVICATFDGDSKPSKMYFRTSQCSRRKAQ